MKSAIRRSAAVVGLVITTLVAAAVPASASSGAVLAEAQPWHYWIAYVLLMSALAIVFIALPVGYYRRVWRLKHPRR